MSEHDDRIRLAAVERCKRLAAIWGEAVPFAEIKAGLDFENEHIEFVGPQGIFKPKQMEEGPLTLTSTIGSPYDDEERPDDNVISYDYAPRSREHENRAARKLVGTFTPAIYFRQVCAVPSEYVIVSPMYLVDDIPGQRKFVLSAIPARGVLPLGEVHPSEDVGMAPFARALTQSYRDRTVKERLHQADFRRSVLKAYRTRCSICELRLRRLLDGAHIIGDKEPGGEPVVQNGLSLCSLHHRAFDRNILRVTPDYKVQIGKVTIDEADKSAVRNLRDFKDKKLWLPLHSKSWPDPERLKKRFESAS